MSTNKNLKGYYIVCIIFILRSLMIYSYVDGTTEILIDLGYYSIYVSDIGWALCQVFIYAISMYGLINNFSWGLISTTLISFYILIINLRDLIANDHSIFSINIIVFLAVFIYLSSVISKKIDKYMQD